jgi:hypothetical protein
MQMKKLSIFLGMILVLVMVAPSYAIKFTVEPANPSVSEGETVALAIYLDDWTEASNVAGADYYIAYNQNATSIVSVTAGPGWKDSYFHDGKPAPGSGMCGVVDYGAGVAGSKMLLQTVVLKCNNGNTDFKFKVQLDQGSVVLDVAGKEYTGVTEAVVSIK